MSAEKSMMLIASEWMGAKSFRLIPVTKECPYLEMIFEATHKVLIVVSPSFKECFHMVAKLNEQGDRLKLKQPRDPQSAPWPEERKMIDTYHEYTLAETKDIEKIINMFAINADEFDWKGYMWPSDVPKIELLQK